MKGEETIPSRSVNLLVCLCKDLQRKIMSPEPNSVKVYDTNSKQCQDCNSDVISASKGESVLESKQIDFSCTSLGSSNSDALLKPPIPKRERRNVSPCLNDALPDPMSPSSSSSTSQATSANDTTFEPTVEMMVNDFDDEQTLNEEEALAALESQDPDEEINTLKEESEIPIEDLLAKYQAMPPMPFTEPPIKKAKKSAHKKKHKPKQKVNVKISEANDSPLMESHVAEEVNLEKSTSVDVKKDAITYSKSGDERDLRTGGNEEILDAPVHVPSLKEKIKINVNIQEKKSTGSEKLKMRRTHLLDLYPEGTFENVKEVISTNGKEIPLETLYGVEDEDDEEVEDEDEEDFKKKVMIGVAYQATIPQGLSQYGDILPYENEDKLIWEPSQVSEKEVEEYLTKIREIKGNISGDEDTLDPTDNTVSTNTKNSLGGKNSDNLENNSLLANGERINYPINGDIPNNGNAESDNQPAVVKDNEQALHLLVQCGYDFKEALRRKRLNALPLTDCMSLWSEEECQKFEEGIQKYGKDFLKIRQNQVRTRTMRELVQFYYLWKKSERRDHNFANADTVDHMDMYLNEDNDYGSNPASMATPVSSPVSHSATSGATRRSSANSQKNISIMSSAVPANNNVASPQPINTDIVANASQQQQQKRHCSSNSNSILVQNDTSNNDCSNSTSQVTSPTLPLAK